MPKNSGVIKLHGREYKTVALRVQEFREKHPISDGWGLTTKIIEVTAEVVIFRAAIIDPQGREIAVGFAEEKRTNRGINATSALENCETSALGRALAAAGFGGSEYASADELVNALNQQKGQDRRPPGESAPKHHASWNRDHKTFLAELTRLGLDLPTVSTFCEGKGWGRPATWDSNRRTRFLESLDQGKLPDLYTPASKQQAS